MTLSLAILVTILVVAVVATLRDLATDGHRPRPADPALLPRLRDREAARLARESADAAADARLVSPTPPLLAASFGVDPRPRAPRVGERRVAR